MLHISQVVEILASKYHAESSDGCEAYVVELHETDALVELKGTGDLYYIPRTRLRPTFKRADT